MKLDEIFLPCEQADEAEAATKRQVLGAVAAAFASGHGLDERQVFDILNERERLGSTAIGDGVAIPHGKLPGLTKLAGCVLRLQTPADFEAFDDEPVDMVVALLAPDTGSAEHLRMLARLSRMLRDPRQRAALRATPDAESLRQALTFEPEERNAA
jgi:PTS system nitrogen regulatory IIA component